MSCSLAICIITYERAESVRAFLENCAAYYIAAGADIYYYDSSRNDETEMIVTTWTDKDHVHYLRLPPELTPNEKMYRVFQGFGWEKHYDFMALTNDSNQFSQRAVEHLMQCLRKTYDIIVYTEKTYKSCDPQEFFNVCGRGLMHLGCTFVNVHTVLENVNWAKYEDIFAPPDKKEDWAEMGAYFIFYFRRILELRPFSALSLSLTGRKTNRWSLPERKKTIYDHNMIQYLCEGWMRTYERIPNDYKEKWKVCAKAASIYATGRLSDFYLYKRKEMFGWTDFVKYWDTWSKVTEIPRVLLAFPAITPRKILKICHESKMNWKEKQMETFCRRHKRVFIYGAGTNGAIVGSYMTAHGMGYEAYCTTEKKPGKDFFKGYPVYEFEELFVDCDENTGFVIAMRQRNAKAVLRALEKCIDAKHCFYYPMLVADIREEMGCSAYSGFYV